jgi:murein DD-endopeptidase MepM/ murein hydrolase activator NlpD
MNTTLIKPFLGSIFSPDTNPFISAGFEYDSKEKATHGVQKHQAIDFDVPRGTTVYAPTDGYYVATFGEILLEEESGIPRLVSVKKAKAGNPYSEELRPPAKNGEWPIWFGGLFIQGWHKNGMYTQYGHLDWVDPLIPYYPPSAHETNLLYSEVLKIDPHEYKKPEVAVFLKAGTPIATTGMTGMGWGPRSFDFAALDKNERPDFSTAQYTHYTSPHLHFAIFGPRDSSGEPTEYFDPFGVYGTLSDAYPTKLSDWKKFKTSLWK